ncbi:arsenite efflux transporter metallochaperone ArsD [Ruminococcus callidus]|uniref:arsenite efflux transporter metallochaperone ArsD n=1 Tax=Ruminococcus callidus TaxID=40519 RepID=UPI0026735BB6|nr:arsenite efflux transporter metallochaperone ArsD [uncultured Ruminococcus sp.]
MKKMCIYEPALCCETGLCGVNVDPELLRISTVLNTLKSEGVVIERYNLNNAPMEFVKSSIVNQYVNEKGVDGLPVVTVDGEIVLAGRYPANDEILTLLDLPAELLLPKGAASCCCDTDCTETCCEPEETDNNGCCCGSSCC